MSTLEIIFFVLFLAFCIYNAIFLIIHPVYTEEELKAMREEKKARRKAKKIAKRKAWLEKNRKNPSWLFRNFLDPDIDIKPIRYGNVD